MKNIVEVKKLLLVAGKYSDLKEGVFDHLASIDNTVLPGHFRTIFLSTRFCAEERVVRDIVLACAYAYPDNQNMLFESSQEIVKEFPAGSSSSYIFLPGIVMGLFHVATVADLDQRRKDKMVHFDRNLFKWLYNLFCLGDLTVLMNSDAIGELSNIIGLYLDHNAAVLSERLDEVQHLLKLLKRRGYNPDSGNFDYVLIEKLATRIFFNSSLPRKLSAVAVLGKEQKSKN